MVERLVPGRPVAGGSRMSLPGSTSRSSKSRRMSSRTRINPPIPRTAASIARQNSGSSSCRSRRARGLRGRVRRDERRRSAGTPAGPGSGIAAGVRSPLADAGLTKAEIRPPRASSGCRRGMPLRRPAYRVASSTDSSITRVAVETGEQGEAYLRRLGIGGDLRVRHLGVLPALKSSRPGFVVEAGAPEVSAHLSVWDRAGRDRTRAAYRRGSLLERSSP